jgi:hypothetical protein
MHILKQPLALSFGFHWFWALVYGACVSCYLLQQILKGQQVTTMGVIGHAIGLHLHYEGYSFHLYVVIFQGHIKY